MQSKKSKSLIKWPSISNQSKTNYNISNTLQKLHSTFKPQIYSPNKYQKNIYPSYPIIEYRSFLPEVKQGTGEQKVLERKTSAFLRSYNEKLKRQRKRISKKKSTTNSKFRDSDSQNESMILNHIDSSSSILVFKKSSLLDTFHSNLFNSNKDYAEDTKFQQLLKQINRLKKIQQKQIKKVNQNKFQTLQNSKKSKQKSNHQQNSNNQKYFFKYNSKEFDVPLRKFLSSTIAKSHRRIDNAEEDNQRLNKKDIKRQSTLIEKYYNFTQLDPWENQKQLYHQSIRNRNSIDLMKSSFQ